ncbi:HAD family hydrolase [Mesomycoplasma neurolyticum]|uniref:Putative phosphotransferase n=1 Tax=Mesomycoplasma neurolyticum TaxID=2120 RepID=A0A449A496_9BACT|nr:HAD family hydrolase [Mesomycoplasma neurolyticum]VEU59067.1 putative phosphotransferase [Mesomycoplasma neurolyticum]
MDKAIKSSFSIKKDVKVVFSDLDGTLLQSDKSISPNSIQTIIKLKNNNKLFGVATGRPYYFVKKEITLLKPDFPIISCNGALIFDYKLNKVIFYNSFTKDQVSLIWNILTKNNITFLVYQVDKMQGYHPEAKVSKWFKWVEDTIKSRDNEHKPEFVILNKEQQKNFLNQENKIVKFLMIKTDSNELDLEKALKELNEIPGIYAVQSHPEVVDIMRNESTKGTGIEMLAKKYNFDLNKTLVFGDESNDISMFEKAKYSVAMEQAPVNVKKVSTFITKSNDEDGIFHFVEKHFE